MLKTKDPNIVESIKNPKILGRRAFFMHQPLYNVSTISSLQPSKDTTGKSHPCLMLLVDERWLCGKEEYILLEVLSPI